MFKNLTYKQKLKYLGIAVVVSFFIVFHSAIRKTINLKGNVKKLELTLEDLNSAPGEIIYNQKKILDLEKSIGSKIEGEQSVQEVILEKASKYCHENKLVITEFLRPHQYKTQNYLIETNIITIEGSFIKLLKMVYQFEQVYRVGKVTSVRFATNKDKKTKRNRLTAKIFIQNIKIYENEK